VTVEAEVFIAPQASIRGDEGQGIQLATASAVLDGAVITGRPTEQRGLFLERNTVRINYVRYSVHVGERTTVGAHTVLRGPVALGEDVWVGPQSVVDDATVGKGCILEPRCVVQGGVRIGEGRYVPSGRVVSNQAEADALPAVSAAYARRDEAVRAAEVNRSLALAYGALYPRSGLEDEGHGAHGGHHATGGDHGAASHGASGRQPVTPEHEPVSAGHEEGAAGAPPPDAPQRAPGAVHGEAPAGVHEEHLPPRHEAPAEHQDGGHHAP
jgi:carbonic anhydrase/acetyltransferase-like protein (isoleucine patch superfamily)